LLLMFVALGTWWAAPNAKSNLGTEAADTTELLNNMLAIQMKFAEDQGRPLARGTHAKGTCVGGQFEVFDVRKTAGDAALGDRLAKGLYARPATYPASVRFANGESHIYPDSTRDVRALSFSVDLTSAGASPGTGPRQDYTMNNATVFPLNDAHEFAVATRIALASSPGKGIMSLPLRDKFGFLRTATLARLQQQPGRRAYQQARYWSTVPYRHGPTEVIKYSALPCAGNKAQALGAGDNAIQDELIRNVNDDQPASCFDFALQLLEVGKMTRYATRRTADFWIENASVEWKQAEAPFYTVGRLTLVPKSVLTADACDAQHIDVTGNSTPDSAPLGSINRARSAAEAASRKARSGQQ
jgi:hypothetical protein